MMKNFLLINGHEYWEKSPGRLNKTLMDEASNLLNVKGMKTKLSLVDQGWKVDDEVEKYLWADVVLYFVPVYWFSIPAGFKAYQERVFSGGKGRLYVDDGRKSGGQYGSGGLMQNKKYMLFTTWNAPETAFNNSYGELMENKSVDDVFLHFHLAHRFIGMKKMPTFSFYDVKNKPDISRFVRDLQNHIRLNFDF